MQPKLPSGCSLNLIRGVDVMVKGRHRPKSICLISG